MPADGLSDTLWCDTMAFRLAFRVLHTSSMITREPGSMAGRP